MESKNNQTMDDRVATDAVHRIFRTPSPSPTVYFTCSTCKITLPTIQIGEHFKPPHESEGLCKYCAKPCYKYVKSDGASGVWHRCPPD